jgi:pyruvate dehydrogenase E1 component alpha subunit
MFSKEHMAASSGIVGAEGPAAAGFALSAQYLNTGAIAVAFFGEGAMNQGMLMESFNLASAWKLPVLFVCKDDGWAITTQSDSMIAGDLNERAKGFGMPAVEVDGRDVSELWEATHAAIEQVRSGQGPFFFHARCIHMEGHFLGYQLLRVARDPLKEMPEIAAHLTRSFMRRSGAELRERVAGLKKVLAAVLSTLRDPRKDADNDPVQITRNALLSNQIRLRELESQAEEEISDVLASALEEVRS